MAEQLIGAMSMSWDPGEFHDTFQEKVAALIEAKKADETVEKAEPAAEPTGVVDLMEALRASGERAGSPKATGGKASASSKAAAKKAPAKKRIRSTPKEDLSRLSKADLYKKAAAANLPGRPQMSRDDVVKPGLVIAPDVTTRSRPPTTGGSPHPGRHPRQADGSGRWLQLWPTVPQPGHHRRHVFEDRGRRGVLGHAELELGFAVLAFDPHVHLRLQPGHQGCHGDQRRPHELGSQPGVGGWVGEHRLGHCPRLGIPGQLCQHASGGRVLPRFIERGQFRCVVASFAEERGEQVVGFVPVSGQVLGRGFGGQGFGHFLEGQDE
ncbi:hypothetical protein [Streptomyces subrutilus]|uniref:hypothetical protein n=1 Tax=Streptomyces subrutilus TaxID=36818 RepID=UPI0033D915E1